MTRTPLLIFLLASVVCGGAWWTQARAAAAAAAGRAPAEAAAAQPVPAPTRKMDEYGDISFEDEKARLDNLAIELQNDPTAEGYLICYGGRVGRKGEAGRRCDRARGYLSGYRHIPSAQIVTLGGGFREYLTVELWVVPRGAKPPQAAPTVDPKEVRFVRARPKRRGRGR
jgi:hypothetical protein